MGTRPLKTRFALAIGAALLALVQGVTADELTSYTFALSWSPTWCDATGEARGADQCDADADHRFIVHGLWPNVRGDRDDFCRTHHRDPNRRTVRSVLDIMPDEGLVRHQWRKHGTCSGQSPEDYFALVRTVREKVTVPPGLATLSEPIDVRPAVLREAFLTANPWIENAGLFVHCRGGDLVDVRICLAPDLTSTACPNVRRRRCRDRLIDVPAPD